jgi:hypothetical protein
MYRNLKWLSILGGFVTVAAFASLGPLAQPTVANAARIIAAPAPHAVSGTCVVEISTIALTPLVTNDGSGGNVLFNGTKPNEPSCDREAIVQWRNALSTGWSPANRCAIISQTGYSDEILTEITYIWNGNPSVREDGYAIMCHPTADVNAPAY